MIIGIDGNEANTDNRVGVHQYAYEIIRAIYKQNWNSKNKNKFIIYLKSEPRSDFPESNDWWRYKVLPAKKVWILSRLMPYLLVNNEVDVLFSPSHYTPLVTRIPVVCTIHDLGYLDSTEQFKRYDFWQLKLWTAKSISVSKSIIAVSESTKRDIVRHYSKASLKVSVVHHGYDKDRFNITMDDKVVRRDLKRLHLEEGYILFLSTLKPSKNIEGLLDAYSIYRKQYNGDESLVIAGKKGWLYESIFRRVQKLGIEKHVKFLGFVSEELKPSLYYGARVFALPVYWEGFGMTALESIACGTPVVASKKGGLPEVLGTVGSYVDPMDIDGIARDINEIMTMSENNYKALVKNGISQANKFSWAKAARETIKVIENACQK